MHGDLTATLLFLAACSADKLDSAESDTSAETAPDTDTGTYSGGDREGGLTAEGVDVVITNGSGRYRFGLVQSGTADNWTGEDCWNGYTTGTGEVYRYCHEISSAGGTLTRTDTLPLEEGQTLFYDGIPGSVGFYLEDESGACYVWGDAAAWWDSLGCTSL
jgi:hypothetical protein